MEQLSQEDIEFWKEQNISVLESLKILFNSDSSKHDYWRNVVLYKWGDWTLKNIYNYYIIEEETSNIKLQIIKEENNNTTDKLEIKKGSFDF